MDRGPIPGWAPADERSLTGDAARRPVGAVVGEAFGLYRRHARPLLLMTAVLEVPATLLALPYLVLTWSVLAESLASLPSVGELVGAGRAGRRLGHLLDVRLHGALPRPRRPAGRCARRRGGHPALRGHDHPGRTLRSLPAGTGVGHAESARGRPANAPSLAAAAPRRASSSSLPGHSWASAPALVNARTLDAQLAGGCESVIRLSRLRLRARLPAHLRHRRLRHRSLCVGAPGRHPRSDRPARGGPAQRPSDAPARPSRGPDPGPGRPDHRRRGRADAARGRPARRPCWSWPAGMACCRPSASSVASGIWSSRSWSARSCPC